MSAVGRLLAAFSGLLELWRTRRYAKRNGLDFRLTQVTGQDLWDMWQLCDLHHGTVVHLTMRCGRVGRYRATITHIYDGGHGHKDWRFTFIGYVN